MTAPRSDFDFAKPPDSLDSRAYGPVTRDAIERRAVSIVYPIERRADLP